MLPLLIITILTLALRASFTTASSVLVGRSELDGPCTGASSAPGVCVPTAKCTASGGSFISDACPGTPKTSNAAPNLPAVPAMPATAASLALAIQASRRRTSVLDLRASNAVCLVAVMEMEEGTVEADFRRRVCPR